MQVERPEDKEEKFWFRTPENYDKEAEHSAIKKRTHKELRQLSERENLDSTEDEDSRKKFL